MQKIDSSCLEKENENEDEVKAKNEYEYEYACMNAEEQYGAM